MWPFWLRLVKSTGKGRRDLEVTLAASAGCIRSRGLAVHSAHPGQGAGV